MHNVKATISSGYRWRLVLITLMMLGFGVYCIYDWKIGYPHVKEVGLAYQEHKDANPDTYPETWPVFAAEQGWETKVPKKLKTVEKYDSDIRTQLIMACITLPIGLLFLFKLVKESLRWVAMGEDGLTASGGHVVPWESVQGLDDTRWKTKGIAWLHYKDANGAERKILLDDFKSEREPVQQIVKQVQEVLDPGAAEGEAAADVPPADPETPAEPAQ